VIEDLARVLQEAATDAFPPTRLSQVDGWWLRHSDTPDWWNASVLPHGPVPRALLPERIAQAEAFYAGRAAFQISPAASPGLDAALTARGYQRDADISLQTADNVNLQTADNVNLQTADNVKVPPNHFPVRVCDSPDAAWLTTWAAMHGDPRTTDQQQARMRRITHPAAYASALDDEGVIAVGRAVRTNGWTGIFGMATVPRARGRGAAAHVLAALANWAGTPLYLQVEQRNTPALRLYARTGFTERYRYHFLRQTPGT
jgi:GNAT superfamily N-acetyltransferase